MSHILRLALVAGLLSSCGLMERERRRDSERIEKNCRTDDGHPAYCNAKPQVLPLTGLSEAVFADYSLDRRCDGIGEFLAAFGKQHLGRPLQTLECLRILNLRVKPYENQLDVHFSWGMTDDKAPSVVGSASLCMDGYFTLKSTGGSASLVDGWLQGSDFDASNFEPSEYGFTNPNSVHFAATLQAFVTGPTTKAPRIGDTPYFEAIHSAFAKKGKEGFVVGKDKKRVKLAFELTHPDSGKAFATGTAKVVGVEDLDAATVIQSDVAGDADIPLLGCEDLDCFEGKVYRVEIDERMATLRFQETFGYIVLGDLEESPLP